MIRQISLKKHRIWKGARPISAAGRNSTDEPTSGAAIGNVMSRKIKALFVEGRKPKTGPGPKPGGAALGGGAKTRGVRATIRPGSTAGAGRSEGKKGK